MEATAEQQESLADPQSEEALDHAAESSPHEMVEPTAALERLETTVTDGFASVLQAFEDKLAYDETKERQITRLHDELQEHRRDLVARTKRPLIQGLVRLHDDLGKVVETLRQRPAEEQTAERFFRALDGLADDLELLLAQHGVEPFTLPGEAFDPRHQTALRTETTDDPEMAGLVAARLRPGFQEGETLLQKERVAVYAASRSPEAEPPQCPPRETIS